MMKAVIKIVTPAGSREENLPFNQDLTIGRSSKANVIINDERMSSLHLKVNFLIDRITITDLKSSNGTYLNGIRIEQSDLHIGDQVKFGTSTLTLVPEKMSQDVIDFLSTTTNPDKTIAPGEDASEFTRARLKNQQMHKIKVPKLALSEAPARVLEKETVQKKAPVQKYKMSKEEILESNKLLSALAFIFDTAVFLGIGFIIFRFLPKKNMEDYEVIFFSEAGFIIAFIFFNTKLMKFTLGQMLFGLRSKFIKQ